VSIDVRITLLICLDSFPSASSFLTYLLPHVHLCLHPIYIHTSIHPSAPFIRTSCSLMFSLMCMCMYVHVHVCMYVYTYEFPVSCLCLCRMCILSFLPGCISVFGALRLVCSIAYSQPLLFFETKQINKNCIYTHFTVPIAVHIALPMFIYSFSGYISLRVNTVCVHSALRTYLHPHLHCGLPPSLHPYLHSHVYTFTLA